MSDQEKSVVARDEAACAFCAEILIGDDTIASIRLLSRSHGQRYFGAHVRCLRDHAHPEIARLVDLDDVPPGLDHLLPLAARQFS